MSTWVEDSCLSRVISSSFLPPLVCIWPFIVFLLRFASELSWMVIPVVVLPRSPPPMTMVRGLVLGFELVGIRDVPVGIETLWWWYEYIIICAVPLHTDTWVYKNSKHDICVFASKHVLWCKNRSSLDENCHWWWEYTQIELFWDLLTLPFKVTLL